MGEFDLEALVLEVVRNHTARPDAGPRSRFEDDLGLSDQGRKNLFAFMVQALTARGLNLPGRGFYLNHFLACETAGDAQEAIREAVSGTKRKPAGAVKPPAPSAPAAPAPAAPAVPERAQPAPPPVAVTAAVARKKSPSKAPPKSKPKAKSAAAKKKPPARKAPARRRAA